MIRTVVRYKDFGGSAKLKIFNEKIEEDKVGKVLIDECIKNEKIFILLQVLNVNYLNL